MYYSVNHSLMYICLYMLNSSYRYISTLMPYIYTLQVCMIFIIQYSQDIFNFNKNILHYLVLFSIFLYFPGFSVLSGININNCLYSVYQLDRLNQLYINISLFIVIYIYMLYISIMYCSPSVILLTYIYNSLICHYIV